MQYQISYYSPNGHAENLVKAFCKILPDDTYVSNLVVEDTPYAEVQLVGFDYVGTNLNSIPLCIMEYLDKLDEKTVFLFATLPFLPNDTVEHHVYKKLTAFVPYHCDLRGLYLCGAQPPDVLIQDLKTIVSQQPENTRAKHWLDRCEYAVGHPDRTDIQKGCEFARHVLKLNIE